MLELMSRKRARTRLAKALPIGWEMSHKTGLLRRACHDVGIVHTPRGDFLIAVLTGENRDYHKAKRFIADVGEASFAYWQGDYSLFAQIPSGGGAR